MRRALVPSLIVLLVAASAAFGDQMSADDDPTVNGPLTPAGSGCGGGRVKSGDKTIGRVRSCIRLYEFDQAMESDPSRSYGVAWIQATVDPVRGWCVTRANTDLELPAGVAKHGRAPARPIELSRTQQLRVRLVADADGNALENGSVAQRFTAYKGSFTPKTVDGGNTLRLAWRGRQPRKLAFVMGAEISWEFLSAPQIKGGLGRLRFVKSKTCRP